MRRSQLRLIQFIQHIATWRLIQSSYASINEAPQSTYSYMAPHSIQLRLIQATCRMRRLIPSSYMCTCVWYLYSYMIILIYDLVVYEQILIYDSYTIDTHIRPYHLAMVSLDYTHIHPAAYGVAPQSSYTCTCVWYGGSILIFDDTIQAWYCNTTHTYTHTQAPYYTQDI